MACFVLDLRFPTALQIVLSLAVADESDARCTSSELAAGLGANPVLVRRLLVPLARAGLVKATSGRHGGVRLARRPKEITLGDVYRAVVDDKRLFTARLDVPSRCVVSSQMGTFFETLAHQAEQAVQSLLETRTVAESLAEMRANEARSVALLMRMA